MLPAAVPALWSLPFPSPHRCMAVIILSTATARSLSPALALAKTPGTVACPVWHLGGGSCMPVTPGTAGAPSTQRPSRSALPAASFLHSASSIFEKPAGPQFTDPGGYNLVALLRFLNPWQFGLCLTGLSDTTSNPDPGYNTDGFSAISGWDPVTGHETPDATAQSTGYSGTPAKRKKALFIKVRDYLPGTPAKRKKAGVPYIEKNL
ncbi:hypothetical protein BJY52DRAFT_1393492 [Lactarius psammicola]|nr:hypothetical protein BJY52DRAFT_1393492 [Lactarius psammicola]